VKVLDCSIRDGGHLNKWRFDFSFAKKLYEAVSNSGIDFIELGYRTKKGVLEDTGIWRHTSDEVIRSVISEKSDIKIAIMADIGKITKEDFLPKNESPIDLVRLAFYRDGLDGAMDMSNDLIDKGYAVSFNLMGIVQYNEEQLEETIRKIRGSNVDIVFIADSFGSLYPTEVTNLVKLLKGGTGKAIGFHPHNSLQLAFANTISAIEAGAEYVDGSMNGIGRGAGNLPLETILLFLNRFNNQRYDLIPVLEFVDKELKIVKYDIKWGYDIPYLLSGMNDCHPSYPLTLMEKGYSIRDVFSILSNLKGKDAVGFDKELLEKTIKDTVILDRRADVPLDLSKITINISPETPSYVGRHRGKDFLIIANGPSLNEYEKEIKSFIKKRDLVLIGSNYLGKKFIPDYHVFNNFDRFKTYISLVDKKSKILIGSYLAEHLKKLKLLLNYETIQYVSQSGFDIKNGVIYTEPSTVGILMISLAIVMGAKNIFICGMDGYKSPEPKTHFYDEKMVARLDTRFSLQKKMEDDLKNIHDYMMKNKLAPFKIITPTSFSDYYDKGCLG
jgi:4-hydroxy 2-oxovalerate aldolase